MNARYAPPGTYRHVQVPGGFLALAKIIDVKIYYGIPHHTLIRWIDVRREAEWVPSAIVPFYEPEHTLQQLINSTNT